MLQLKAHLSFMNAGFFSHSPAADHAAQLPDVSRSVQSASAAVRLRTSHPHAVPQ